MKIYTKLFSFLASGMRMCVRPPLERVVPGDDLFVGGHNYFIVPRFPPSLAPYPRSSKRRRKKEKSFAISKKFVCPFPQLWGFFV